jgi:hypothetical protein
MGLELAARAVVSARENSAPGRLLLDFRNDRDCEEGDEEGEGTKLFTVIWTNSSRFFSRPLTYVFTLSDIVEEEKENEEKLRGGIEIIDTINSTSFTEGLLTSDEN